jgi:hypothetical protein
MVAKFFVYERVEIFYNEPFCEGSTYSLKMLSTDSASVFETARLTESIETMKKKQGKKITID